MTIKLKPGNYLRTADITDDQLPRVIEAFRMAGCDVDGIIKLLQSDHFTLCRRWSFVGWDTEFGLNYRHDKCFSAIEVNVSDILPTPPGPSHKYYIAGPMTGFDNYNRDAFNAEEQRLVDEGHVVLNPAVLPDGLEQEEYMEICMSMLFVATHVRMLPGWAQSQGASAEHALAVKCGKTVEYV